MSRVIPTDIFSPRSVRNGPVRIYLCGPIAKNDWRHKLVPGLRTAFRSDGESARHEVLTELPTITNGFVCNGPWFVDCDHGCMHGPCQHGALGYCFDEGQQDRDIVFRANIERINRADAVFAYIDRGEAYGSPFELGYARGKGKPIFVGFPPKVPWQNDMWFSAQAGLGLKAGHVGEVTTLWRQFCQRLDLEIRLAEWVEETAALGAWQSFNPES